MLVPHVTVEIKLLELSETTEAQEAENLFAEVVAEVAVRPNLLERSAVFDSGCWRRVFCLVNFTVT